MIISSELTGKTYKTVEECLEAEKRYHEEKREYDKKLDEAYEEAIAACDRYFELAGANAKKRGVKVFGDIDIDIWDELKKILAD